MSDITPPINTHSQKLDQDEKTTAPPNSASNNIINQKEEESKIEGGQEEDAMEVDVDDEMFDDNVDSLPVDSEAQTKPANIKEDKDEQDSEDETNAEKNDKSIPSGIKMPPLPEFTKKDKTLHEILEMMEDFYPIIPDAITDYYLTKNGLQCDDVRVKRILALATQKFISDIATDAYEYSRIRSQSTVYNSSNPQVRAKALMAGAVGGLGAAGVSTTGNTGNNSKKVVLTTEDLSSALSEYGLNVTRPDFYR